MMDRDFTMDYYHTLSSVFGFVIGIKHHDDVFQVLKVGSLGEEVCNLPP